MKTHLYTLCWNEADMLGFFFRNYDAWVDRYFVYDDGSTDGSIEILKAHPRVELRDWHRKFPDSYLMSQIDWLNEVWKESRGCADWAVIVDIDEHLFLPQSPMQDLLERYKSQGITLIPALGFQMLSEDFPKADEHLVQSRTWGTPWQKMCKLSIFNPDAIEETNFTGGRHTANFTGRLKLPRRDELLLFHYKYLGFERTLEKQNSQHANLGAHDIAMEAMYQYAWPRRELRDFWDNFLEYSEDMSWPNCSPDNYLYSDRWWRPWIICFLSRWLKRAKRFLRNPFYMSKRLQIIIAGSKQYLPPEKIGPLIEEIYRSPIRIEIYQLIIKSGSNCKEGDTVVVYNGDEKKGIVIQCQHSVNADTPQSPGSIQKAIAAKKENEEKYQKEFDAFVITNSKGFAKNAVKIAKHNDIKLVSRKDLIEFISQVKVSC